MAIGGEVYSMAHPHSQVLLHISLLQNIPCMGIIKFSYSIITPAGGTAEKSYNKTF